MKCDSSSFLKSHKQSNTTNTTTDESNEPKVYQGYCFMKMHNKFYDLNPLSSSTPYKIGDLKGHSINLNFCGNVKVDANCTQQDSLIQHNHKNCRRFAGKSTEDKTWSLVKNAKGKESLQVVFPPGDICSGNKRFTTTVQFTCDKKAVNATVNALFDDSKCENTVLVTSKYACSSGKFTAWWNQFGISKKTLAAGLIIIGLYFLLVGVYFWRFNSLMINCAILGLILFSFVSLYTKVNLGGCMIFGCVIAIVAMNFPSFNGIILGVNVGYLFGSLLYNVMIGVIIFNPQALYWATLVSCILFVSIAGGFMQEYMVCLATSMVGAYAFIRGISIYAGGYPDETYVMTLINHGEYSQFGRIFGGKVYAYIGGIFALTAVGYFVQNCLISQILPAQEVDKKAADAEGAAKADENNAKADEGAAKSKEDHQVPNSEEGMKATESTPLTKSEDKPEPK